MATHVPPKRAAEFILYVGLVSQVDAKLLQANPTLAAGDVKIAKDDGAPADLATLPVVDADFTKRIKVVLSATEMTADNVTILFSDAAGAEWADLMINIQTAARQVDDLAFPSTSGRSIQVEADGMVHADVKELLGDGQSATDLKDFADAGYDPLSNKVEGVKLADTLTTYTGDTPQSGDAFARLGAPIGASISADVADIEGKVDELEGRLTSGRATLLDQLDPVTAGTLANEVEAVKAKTDNLPADPADQSLIIAATDAIMGRLGAPAGVSVSADIADVEGKVDDLEGRLTAARAALIDQLDPVTAGTLANEVEAIKAKTDSLPASPADTSDIPTADQNADAYLDRADAIEPGVTPRGAMRLNTSILVGKTAGAGTGTETFRNAVADTKNRVVTGIDANKNRTSVTTDTT
ncbi:MAG: hypothetical protein ACREMZ_15660 [Gemmatimonadales bacterium]